MTVSGGPGGVDAHLDDMDTVADTLSGLAGELGILTAKTVVTGTDIRTIPYAVSAPVAWAKVEIAEFELGLAATGLATELAATASALKLAAGAYRATDAAVQGIVDDVLTGVGNVAGHMFRMALPGIVLTGLGIYVGAHVIDYLAECVGRDAGFAYRPRVADRVENLVRTLTQQAQEQLQKEAFEHPDAVQVILEYFVPGFVTGLAGVPPGLQVMFDDGPWVDDSQEATAIIITVGRYFGYFQPGEIIVRRVSGSEVRARQGMPAPGTLAELYKRQLETHSGRENGRIRIDTIRGADGKTRAIVYIPATTDWSAQAGENTTDTTTNVETMAGQESAMREAVMRALAEQNLPPGTEVMLVGYSQGGIVAMSLADDPNFRNAHNVTAVVTVGSPVADFTDIPDGIEVMSIEHSNDLVPHLDGNDNPDRSNWTTVDVDADLPGDQDPSHAHSGQAYTDTITTLENEDNAALKRFRQERAEFFNGQVEDSAEYEAKRY